MRKSKAQIITFANIKGGVGKTTAVTNIAYLLGVEFGKKVLVVDADDQGNATKALGVRDRFDRREETLWCALSRKMTYDQVMVESSFPNVWVIASTKELKNSQTEFGRSARGLKLFKHLLKGVSENFDYVLIDTKPQVNILLQSALAASHWYLIPSFPEPDSYDGFLDLVAECEEIRDEENEELKCLGVMLSCVKKIPAHDSYVRFIGKHLKNAKVQFLKPAIRVSNAVATGSLHSCPAVSLSTAHSVKQDYRKLTKSLMKAVELGSKTPRPDLKMLGIIRDQNSSQNEEDILVDDTIQEINLL